MLSISQLAREVGLSRSTLLYYERIGLLLPCSRNSSGYRLYGDREISRLKQIKAYRELGLPVADICALVDTPNSGARRTILEQQFQRLAQEIDKLRQQQQMMLKILSGAHFEEGNSVVNKERWVEIMRAAGLTDKDMRNWHHQFEAMEPEAHNEFLQSLGIAAAEIEKIREWSRETPN